MAGTQFAWSDEQVKQPPPSGGAGPGAFAWSDEDKEAKTAEDTTAHIGVNRGPQPSSPGYRYSEGFAGEGDAPRKYSGGFIDRATSQFGQDLENPRNFLPSWKDLVFPGWTQTEQDYQRWKHSDEPRPDPAEDVGHLGIPALTALTMHAADLAPNPYPEAPLPRVPVWKQTPPTETEIPSILNRQPYAQPATPRVRSAPASVVAAPGEAGSMAASVYPGAPFPTASAEQLNPALVSPSRTLPGQIGVEVTRPGFTTPEAIPPRSGLMLESPRDAILRRLGDQAASIQQEEAAAVPPEDAAAPAPVVRPGRPLKVNGRKVDPNIDLSAATQRAVDIARKRRGLPVQ